MLLKSELKLVLTMGCISRVVHRDGRERDADYSSMDMMRSEWFVGDLSNLESKECLTMNPTPVRRLTVDGFPDQSVSALVSKMNFIES